MKKNVQVVAEIARIANLSENIFSYKIPARFVIWPFLDKTSKLHVPVRHSEFCLPGLLQIRAGQSALNAWQ